MKHLANPPITVFPDDSKNTYSPFNLILTVKQNWRIQKSLLLLPPLRGKYSNTMLYNKSIYHQAVGSKHTTINNTIWLYSLASRYNISANIKGNFIAFMMN